MRLIAPLALATTLAANVLAQSPALFSDPANLRGERPAPLTGRELPVDQGALGLQQILRRLNTRASLMLIVAHPDDEDGGMLTYVSRGLGARVAMFTLNRGEGGQNAMTGDFEDALGLLRTQELLSADRYLGTTQMFGTEVDFGFTKTKEEAFAKWTHERVLYDAVRAVRLYRPLVIASVFIGGVTDGHGQHQVSGEIAQEVFKAAADPKIFPELTAEGILPWQPLKVYARVPQQAITPQGLFDYATGQYAPAQFTNYVTGEVSATAPATNVVVHEGAIDPILGPYPAKEPFVSYVQFARQGLGLQKSQIGPGMRMPGPGTFDVSYHRYASRVEGGRQKMQEDTFFDGIDTSLPGIATLAPDSPVDLHAALTKIATQINLANQQLNPENLPASAPYLASALHQTEALIATVEKAAFSSAEQKADVLHELKIKSVQLNTALALSLELSIRATVDSADLPSGKAATAYVHLEKASSTPVTYLRGWSSNGSGSAGDGLAFEGAPVSAGPALDRECVLGASQTPVTRPYFTRKDIEQPVYEMLVPELRSAAATPPALSCWAEFRYQDVKVTVGTVARSNNQPVRFVPGASLSLSSHAQVLPTDQAALKVSAFLMPMEKPAVKPQIHVPADWKAHTISNETDNAGETSFQIEAPAGHRSPITARASATLENGHNIVEGYRPIGYGDLPRTNYFTPATDRIVPVDLKLPQHHRLGYLPGTGDDVPMALASIGLKPEILSVADLTPSRLANYDTVILGVRTYNAHPDLHGAPTRALLDYARNGGNVVVQYQTAEFTAEDAPYPLTLGRDAERVIDETDPVELLDPKAPLLSTPNALTPADFNGWVEERGHGFLHTWDNHYTALTETHDPGEEPQRGGIVTAQLGKGRWTYVAFAVYRQLPEAVPGAYRLFLNLLNP